MSRSLRSQLSYQRITILLIIGLIGWIILFFILLSPYLRMEFRKDNLLPVQLYLVINLFLFFSAIYTTIQWYKNKVNRFPSAAMTATLLVLFLMVPLIIIFSFPIPSGEAQFYSDVGILIGTLLTIIILSSIVLTLITIFLWLKYLKDLKSSA